MIWAFFIDNVHHLHALLSCEFTIKARHHSHRGRLCTLSSNFKWLLSIFHTELEIFFHSFSSKFNFFFFHTIILVHLRKLPNCRSSSSILTDHIARHHASPDLVGLSVIRCLIDELKLQKVQMKLFNFSHKRAFSRSDDVERLNTSERNIGHGGKILSQTLVSYSCAFHDSSEKSNPPPQSNWVSNRTESETRERRGEFFPPLSHACLLLVLFFLLWRYYTNEYQMFMIIMDNREVECDEIQDQCEGWIQNMSTLISITM